MGKLQLDYLVERGLEAGALPTRRRLRAAARRASHFIEYLETGHYCGHRSATPKCSRPAREARAAAATAWSRSSRSCSQNASRRVRQHSGRPSTTRLAQSVFTHMQLNEHHALPRRDEPRVEPGWALLSLDLREPAREAVHRRHPPVGHGTSHYDSDIWHYGLDAIQFACEGTGLTVEYEGDFGHPKNQKMLVFVRSADV